MRALQHRGQECAGAAVLLDGEIVARREMGLVQDNFGDVKNNLLRHLNDAHSAVAQTRYTTAGDASLRNAQPLTQPINGTVAMVHNGNFVGINQLRERNRIVHADHQPNSDTADVLALMQRSGRSGTTAQLIDALQQMQGAYAIIAMDERGTMVAARDPHGIRPLILGRKDGSPVLASETNAMDIIGAEVIRPVAPGEVLVFEAGGETSLRPFEPKPLRRCMFELVYFARPNSLDEGMDERQIYDIRKRMGAQLAIEQPVEADIVVGIPDSGVPAAAGYHQQSRIPYEPAMLRSHFYSKRTFIEPTQHIRQLGTKLKHTALQCMKGKRVVLVDDSIVRGTTLKKLVELVRDVGASDVHVRISSPPVTHPDCYGIDTPSRDDLLASSRDVAAMADYIGADSLGFLSLDGLYKAVNGNDRDTANHGFADHYFTGDYPIDPGSYFNDRAAARAAQSR